MKPLNLIIFWAVVIGGAWASSLLVERYTPLDGIAGGLAWMFICGYVIEKAGDRLGLRP
jgi:hypothetical protein